MKILLVEPYGTRMGHFGLYATNIGQALSMLGHEVVVVTGTRLDTRQFLRAKPQFRLVEGRLEDVYLSSNGSRLPTLLRKIMHAPAAIRTNLVGLSRALTLSAGEAFDVIHLLSVEPLSSALLLLWHEWIRSTKPPPLVIQIFPTDFSLLHHGANIFRALYKWASAFALKFIIYRYCLAVSVQGEWHRNKIMGQLGCKESDAPPFVIVRPGTSLLSGERPRTEARQDLRLDPEATVFLFFGMLRNDKGIDLLIEASTGLEGNWQLLIAGTAFDWTPYGLYKRIAQTSEPERVRIDVRYIPEEEIGRYFRAADAVVLPYRGKNYAGNYGPMFIACGHGKPLIVSDVGEMGRLVRKNHLGYAVRPDDTDALHEALQAFLRLPEAAKAKMGANTRKFAESCSWASMARLLSEVYADRSHRTVSP